jgi:hypothetical protein
MKKKMTLEEKRTYYHNRSEQMIQQMCELTNRRIDYGDEFTEEIRNRREKGEDVKELLLLKKRHNYTLDRVFQCMDEILKEKPLEKKDKVR